MIKPDPKAFECLQAIFRWAERLDIVHDIPMGMPLRHDCKWCGASGPTRVCAYCGSTK